jgi:hypothetical protein
LDNDENRDSYWIELREEIKSHATKLNCNCVLGYTEQVSIHEDILLLFCSGTAAHLDLSLPKTREDLAPTDTSPRPSRIGYSADITPSRHGSRNLTETFEREKRVSESNEKIKRESSNRPTTKNTGCRACHITYNRHEAPFPMSFNRCEKCKKKVDLIII